MQEMSAAFKVGFMVVQGRKKRKRENDGRYRRQGPVPP